MKHKRTIEISGSHGTLIVCPETGLILDRTDITADDYDDIHMFDVMEFKYNYKKPAESSDILDYGYWYTSGQYVEPDKKWRQLTTLIKWELPEDSESIPASEVAARLARPHLQPTFFLIKREKAVVWIPWDHSIEDFLSKIIGKEDFQVLTSDEFYNFKNKQSDQFS